MNARVSLTYPAQDYFDEVEVIDIEDSRLFSYSDNEGAKCEMRIFDDGLCLLKTARDYELELHLRDRNFARISSPEGIIEIDAKTVAYSINSDILVMRYLINDEERTIRIQYY